MSLPLACDASAHAPAYAEVALVPALPGKDLLTYRVEEAERARIRPGMRVMVPLGRRRETGLVVALASTPPPGLTSIRAVAEVLDAEPIFTPELVALCRWASEYYVTTSGNYNGGLENYPRFHESWTGQTLTYRGSFVSLGAPKHNNGRWCGTGTTCNIYNPPVRNWDFDTDFMNAANLPPLTPRFVSATQTFFTENFR